MSLTPDRWRIVEELCHAALEREAHERSAFLAAACGSDEALRHDVEALLAHEATADGFLTSPIGALAANVLATDRAAWVGRRIGPYHVTARLGSGGMGEVYRARDSKLGRDVAIKVLPTLFASDRERLRRFEREARMLAALNHPHIGGIYGLEDVDGVPALILEYIDGDTMAARLEGGPLPFPEAMTIASQIVEALEAAHEKGIVHRDLKPANIKIASTGSVKVLDFGLAMANSDDSVPHAGDAPTVTVGATHEGRPMGTTAYMSPEQARGKRVDRRTDIWAFGCVLYQMLTGRAAFPGDTASVASRRFSNASPTGHSCPTRRRRRFAGCCGAAWRRIRSGGCPTSQSRGWRSMNRLLNVPRLRQQRRRCESLRVCGLPSPWQ